MGDKLPIWGKMDRLGDLKSKMDHLNQALEKFDFAFPGGLFRLFRLGSAHLVLVRQVESDHFITQAKRAPSPSSSGS